VRLRSLNATALKVQRDSQILSGRRANRGGTTASEHRSTQVENGRFPAGTGRLAFSLVYMYIL
jgi:hypothetical protein